MLLSGCCCCCIRRVFVGLSAQRLSIPGSSRQQRSRVRSNRFSSHQESVGSDNSASSIDNPSYVAAAAAAAAAAGGDFAMECDGMTAGYRQHQRGGSSHRGSSRRQSGSAGPPRSSGAAMTGEGSCQASAVCGHSTAKSAAGILLSLSGCQQPSDM